MRMGPAALLGLSLLGCLALGAQGCPRGWLRFGGHCYGYVGQRRSWAQAEAWCQAARPGAHLAWLRAPAEHRALAAFVAQRRREEEEEEEESVWIGLRQRGRTWLWADGSPQLYAAWDGDEPRAGTRCAALDDARRFLAWEDEACGERKPFVCKCPA